MRQPLQLLIPAAGHGSRFREVGVKTPKPLIPVLDYPMICHVIANFPLTKSDKILIIGQKDHQLEIKLQLILERSNLDFQFVEIDSVTKGAASTCLLAEDYVDPEQALIIANADQWVVDDLEEFIDLVTSDVSDSGYVLTMIADDPKWSYAEINDVNEVRTIVEKEVISKHATVGIYGWSKAKLFFDSAKEMILNGDLSKGEYYVAPTYNYLIANGYTVKVANIGAVESSMYGLGTPTDLQYFLQNADLTYAKTRVRKYFVGKNAH